MRGFSAALQVYVVLRGINKVPSRVHARRTSPTPALHHQPDRQIPDGFRRAAARLHDHRHSKTGARLFADGVDVPDQFHLLISGERYSRRECQVVWRLGGEIGVTFVGPERRMQRASSR